MTQVAPGEGTADPKPGEGAANNQPSETEVTELKAQIATQSETITNQKDELEKAVTSVTDLQTANKKFADDAVNLATQAKQLQDAQKELEESRKTSADLTVKLEQAATTNTGLAETVLTRRRQDLMAKYGLPEERVATLDDAGLTVLESTLPHVPLAQTNGKPVTTDGKGLGLAGGAAATDLSSMTDSERANRIIERLKEQK